MNNRNWFPTHQHTPYLSTQYSSILVVKGQCERPSFDCRLGLVRDIREKKVDPSETRTGVVFRRRQFVVPEHLLGTQTQTVIGKFTRVYLAPKEQFGDREEFTPIRLGTRDQFRIKRKDLPRGKGEGITFVTVMRSESGRPLHGTSTVTGIVWSPKGKEGGHPG